ncbi:MAG TPA: CBS domain-containing protein [Rhodocyclaceae bacterium]|nr:CBS domain-containing protein [Rhodocyclaceae bacterium]
MKVREILAIKGSVIFSINPEQTLRDGVVSMAERDVGSLVCMQDGRLAGMLTFREVLQAVRNHGSDWGWVKIADVMAPNPPTATMGMNVDELRRLMLETHVRYLPVVENGTLAGVISFHDIAKAVLEEQGQENEMLKAYIHDIPQVAAHA